MKKNKAGSSFGLPSGERAFWDVDKPVPECDCPGPPPPQFHLPPPPRPSSTGNSNCLKNPVFLVEICDSVPVIDAEYHYSPFISSFAIILTVVVVFVVFLLFGTFLVVLKKKKIRNVIPRKYCSQDLCDSVSANGIIYEDLTNTRSRALSPHCYSGQTTVPPIEMIDVSSHSDRGLITPVLLCPASPVLHSYNSQELFNPVYEELSNASEERNETDSEGIPRVGVSEDEFAEDELSLGGEAESREGRRKNQDDRSLRGFNIDNVRKDLDPSDVEDRRMFLANSERNLEQFLPSENWEKGKRTNRGFYFSETAQRPESQAGKKKIWTNETHSILPVLPADCSEFRQGFLLKKILHIYPEMMGINIQYSRRPPITQCSEFHSFGKNLFERSHSVFDDLYLHHIEGDIFSTFESLQNSVKNQSQDSSLGSDSGYSNNTSGGKPTRIPKECTHPNHTDSVWS